MMTVKTCLRSKYTTPPVVRRKMTAEVVLLWARAMLQNTLMLDSEFHDANMELFMKTQTKLRMATKMTNFSMRGCYRLSNVTKQ